MVDELNNRFSRNTDIGIAYIYCNFRRQDKQNADDLLASLLKQLVESQPSVPDCVKDLYDLHKRKQTRPSLNAILEVLQSVASIYSRVFIIVDALDECQMSQSRRSKFLSEVFSLQAKTGANFFATSRWIPDIEENFKGCLTREILANYDDVVTYLDGHMSELGQFVLKKPDLREKIKTEIATSVKGMHVHC